MTALPLVITTEGLARFTAAQVDEDIDLGITHVGLTDSEFVAAPTLTALPGEFRSIATISGEAVGGNIVHMIVRDEAAISYSVRGFGLYLDDGTLFAVYGQEDPVFEKAAAAVMLLALDLAFPTEDVDSITFGDTNFLNPPATTERAGVVELATPEETLAGGDSQRAVTPSALYEALADFLPVGFGGLWYGTPEAVPARWAICHGQTVARSDGTGDITLPNMRDRVAVGAGGAFALGDAFGAFEKTVESTTGGAHTHETELGDHSHAAAGLTATVDSAVTGATINYTMKADTASGGTGKTISVPPDPGAAAPALNDAGHAHAAAIGGSTADAGAATVESSSAGAHSHEVTTDVTQPSLAWHFIMRI